MCRSPYNRIRPADECQSPLAQPPTVICEGDEPPMASLSIQRKTCTTCGTEKALLDFHRNMDRKDGRTSECTMCSLAKHKQYYLSHKTAMNRSARAWAVKNPEAYKAKLRRWQEGHRDLVRVRTLNYYYEHREKFRQRHGQLRARNKVTVIGHYSNETYECACCGDPNI